MAPLRPKQNFIQGMNFCVHGNFFRYIHFHVCWNIGLETRGKHLLQKGNFLPFSFSLQQPSLPPTNAAPESQDPQKQRWVWCEDFQLEGGICENLPFPLAENEAGIQMKQGSIIITEMFIVHWLKWVMTCPAENYCFVCSYKLTLWGYASCLTPFMMAVVH